MDATQVPPPPPPPPHISPPQVVSVVGWLLVASFVIAVGTRLATKLSMKRMLAADDYLIVVAMIIGIGQMSATFVQTRLSVTSTPTGDDWNSFQKALYSSQLLFVPTICLAKLSVLFSLHQITPVKEHKGPIIAFVGFVGISLLAFQFATAFQCDGDRWAILSGKCFDQTPFWKAFGVFDIVSDTFIAIFPIYIVSTLQMGLRFKMIVAGVFITRISAIVASVCRLVYLTRSRGTVEFSSYDFWTFILNTEIEQGLSIITACIPFLKPFFESLETGMLAPSHGLPNVVGSSSGSGNRSKKSQQSNTDSYKLRTTDSHGINVSRRISSHSEECGLIKEETSTWVRPVPNSRSGITAGP
ncbi:hypothetical protein K505DRAFT_359648 [Melanomma pulvis-pyrius CBS 109.77]|uniref:Rhodopsin domain-containing protein n=1 Tax=Melanomma pulvis-pyrius CBS 109.77 TaxID=1314802 RepID=A0A6A6XIL0_9PLEO|nr:hypothetical protein K505DRAFT_359648 [Melanomma pulvis-pyrius CBS 109.77]